MAMARGELARAEDRRPRAVRRRAALEERQRIVDHPGGEYLVEGTRFPVLRAGIVHRVAMVLDAHLGELLARRTVELHVMPAAVPEHERGGRRTVLGLLAV